MKKLILAALAASALTSAASAATYVQYEAHFYGSGTSGSNLPKLVTIIVLFNIPSPQTASSTSAGFFGQAAGLNGSYSVAYGASASSISYTGSAAGNAVNEHINIALPAALNGGLTDFESGTGSLTYTNTNPGGFNYSNLQLTSLTTRFSSTAFSGEAFSEQIVNGNVGVPEPATWAMMVGGFGLVGLGLRRNRVRFAFA